VAHDHDHGDDGGCQHEQPTPEQDYAIAHQAFQQGDLKHAAFHITGALAANPAPEEELISIEDGAYFGHVAGQAYVLARSGQLEQAFNLLCQVMRVCPDRGYHVWAVEWLKRCHGKAVDLSPFLGVFADLIQPTIGRLRLRPAERFALAGAMALVRELVLTESGEQSALFLALASGILRRGGVADEAIGLARRSLEVEPTTTGAISLGLACRLADHAKAEEAFRTAQTMDPDPVYEMELARTLWEAGELERALGHLETYRGTLDDEDTECELTRDYLRHKLHGEADGEWIKACIGDAGTPDDVRLLLFPYVGWLPEPGDATINALHQIYEEVGHTTDGGLEIGVSHLEAPSVRLSIALMTQGSTDVAGVSYSFSTVPDPDPRRPRRPVEVELWRYDSSGEVPGQVVGPGEPRVREGVEAIARTGYFLPRWWREARELARELGEAAVPSLLGVMVHPGVPPEGIPGYVWIQRLQLVSALTLAQIDSGWTDSRRRSLLLSLVNGVMDWTMDAAIVALTEVALDEPAALPEVAELFITLLDDLPDQGHRWYAEALGQSFLRLPARPPHERELFEDLLGSLEQDDEEDDEDHEHDHADAPN
jgi:tetratricopeptide (TPR) repeat protein